MPAILASLAAAALFASTPACEVRDTAAIPHPPDSALSLVLNLPAFRVDVRDGSGTTRSYTVAIGSRRYRTPVGRYHVSSVELNPWWHPPDSEWARKEKVTPPGPSNPMGRAKLNFHELYFLHGTPLEESLGSAASHGCVRMASADALDLARRVLAFARPDVSAEEIDAAEASRRTRYYAVRATVPLEIVYRTAEVRDGALELHPDVYRRESATLRARALDALREEGMGEHLVDPVRLDSAVRAARRGHVRVQLELLLRSEDPNPAVETDSIPGPAPLARRGSDDRARPARRRRSPARRGEKPLTAGASGGALPRSSGSPAFVLPPRGGRASPTSPPPAESAPAPRVSRAAPLDGS